ncbi:MAG: TetR/AcrR family transcriptional regulator [Edaphobacter sp.]|uniref:TetR/AcrR family transcriptional regulator n=1 Tax=Edaphobacter sp. TaxID=1934404 RepID=UPI0023A40869|nr:TetR/AcrR family transcriptional regulator [Edaphobacter sp.]MDE1177451.1 TetR/AcrR family transcriptional regulator [Edaphobacter sp.]
MARSVEFDEELAIRAAMEVFWEKGYKGASLRDLTDAMKINPSSLYNTIGDKHALFLRCVQRYTDDRTTYIASHRASGRSPVETLKIFIDDAVTNITTNAHSCMAIKAAFEVAADDIRVQAILKEDNDAMYRFLCSLLTLAIKNGEIKTEEDPKLLTDYLISIYIGWHESFILDRDATKIKRMARFLLRQLTR